MKKFLVGQQNMSCALNEFKIHFDEKEIQKNKHVTLLKDNANFIVKFEPPYGIFNKTTLSFAIKNAFPQGIDRSAIQDCYEFVDIDIDCLIFDNECYQHTFKKKKILFAAPLITKPLLQNIFV